MIKSEIEIIANEVLNKYVSKGGAFKQFDNLFSCENIKYKEIKEENNKFVGVFTKGLNEQKYIMTNSTIDNEGRKNFTIAHELGHYFLSHHLKSGKLIDTIINEDCSNKEPMEYEADYFATCLLMPEQKIASAFKGMLYRMKNIRNKEFLNVNCHNYGSWKKICEELIKRYGVSETALRYRLQTLNLVRFEL